MEEKKISQIEGVLDKLFEGKLKAGKALKKIEVISQELGREVGIEYSKGYIEGFERAKRDTEE